MAMPVGGMQTVLWEEWPKSRTENNRRKAEDIVAKLSPRRSMSSCTRLGNLYYKSSEQDTDDWTGRLLSSEPMVQPDD